MREKKYLLTLVILPIFLLGLATTNVSAQEPHVKVYVDQPQGHIPGEDPGRPVRINIIIEVSGILGSENYPGAPNGIVGWGMDVKVDPDVLDLSRVRVTGATYGYFLFEFTYYHWYPDPTLLAGTTDPTTGYWDEISEMCMPTPEGGAGDYFSGYKLVTLECSSKSKESYSKIDLIDVEYKTADGVFHPVDEVIDGDYNEPLPEFPLGSIAPIALIAAIAYIWWVTKRKTREAM